MSKKTFWWASKKSDLERRVERINQYRDTTTSTDEQLKVARIALMVLLLFTGSLASMNYFLFFSHTLPFWFSIGAALLLTAAIEYGKMSMGLRALQKVFLEGWNIIFESPAQTILWAGTVLFAVFTFVMSVLNSTRGGEAMSAKLGREKHEENFVPDTRYYDEQIASATAVQKEHSANKWHGNIVYQSAKVAKEQAKIIAKLNDDRQKAIDQQRGDWEKRTSITEAETNTAAGMVLKAGGWIEALQLILIVIVAACQKVLSDRIDASSSPSPTSTTTDVQSGNYIGYGSGPSYRPTAYGEQRNPIGFNRSTQPTDRHAPQEQSVPQQTPVPQSPQSVPQQNARMRGLAAQQAILYHLARLQKEPSNFGNPHATVATVAKRVHVIIDELEATLYLCDECSTEVANRVCSYLIEVIQPKIQQHDAPHNLTNIFTRFREITQKEGSHE